MKTRPLAVAGCMLALAFLLPLSATAQSADAGWSLWVGGASDQFEEALPFSPQVGLRWELAATSFLSVGLEATTRFVNMGVACAGGGTGDCPSSELTFDPALSAQARVFIPAGPVRPYLLATAGRAFSTNGLEGVSIHGFGFGLSSPGIWPGRGVSIEARHRTEDRFLFLDHDHWEVMVGIGL